MSSGNCQVSTEKIADTLRLLRERGVRLWSENGQLRYKAPRGLLTYDDAETLRKLRSEIVDFLKAGTDANATEPPAESPGSFDRAPLAFSQLARWPSYQTGERRAMRQVASAIRLIGRLNIDSLQSSLAEVVRRHDALRTRVIVLEGIPVQEVARLGGCKLRLEDLTGLPSGTREREVERLVKQIIFEPVDFSIGPLFVACLLRLRDDEHMLIVALEHMISDGFSLNILTHDLFAAYAQALRSRTFSLPEIPVQFADYAIWQQNIHSVWVERHGAYWDERLSGCKRLRFPEDQGVRAMTGLGWGFAPLRIDRSLKAELREWCRQSRTTPVMAVLTAYVGLVSRWCDASDFVIQYQSDGRASTKLENTIGFFASVLYLRIVLRSDDSFGDLMNRILEEYCKAYEHADFSFIASQVPRPEFTRNTTFNWVPLRSKIDVAELDGSNDAIVCSTVPLAHLALKKLELDQEPGVLLYDTDSEIVGGVHFPLNRFATSTMERFGNNLILFIKALLDRPEACVKDVAIV